MKKKRIKKRVTWAIILILIVVYLCPKPMVRNVKDSKIISIMYRADTWEQLRFFYPSKEVPYIDEDALLQILHQRKALVEVLQPTVIDGFPAEDVTLLITVGDGEIHKNIMLGKLNRITQQERLRTYTIIDADSVLNQILDFLEIDRNTGMPRLQTSE